MPALNIFTTLSLELNQNSAPERFDAVGRETAVVNSQKPIPKPKQNDESTFITEQSQYYSHRINCLFFCRLIIIAQNEGFGCTALCVTSPTNNKWAFDGVHFWADHSWVCDFDRQHLVLYSRTQGDCSTTWYVFLLCTSSSVHSEISRPEVETMAISRKSEN